MNREIKFRGNSINPFDNWVFGSLWVIKDSETEKTEYVIQGDGVRCSVVPESVGQYTGIKDKNGKDVYEWDILQWTDKDLRYCGQIYWSSDAYGFRIAMPKGYMPSFILLSNHLEVIGNNYENPELLNKQL